MGCRLDLKDIALRARNAEYNPKVRYVFCIDSVRRIIVIVYIIILQRFAAVIMRIREPRTTALVFSSGTMVCTGAKRYI